MNRHHRRRTTPTRAVEAGTEPVAGQPVPARRRRVNLATCTTPPPGPVSAPWLQSRTNRRVVSMVVVQRSGASLLLLLLMEKPRFDIGRTRDQFIVRSTATRDRGRRLLESYDFFSRLVTREIFSLPSVAPTAKS